MKTKFGNFSVKFLLLPLILVAGCNIEKVQDEIFDTMEVFVTLPNFTSFMDLEVMDAKSQDLVDGDFQVRVVGDDADKLYDMLGYQHESYDANGGLFQLAIDPNIVPTEENPLSVRVAISKPGYVTQIKEVIMDNDSLNSARFFMVSKSAPPQGVVIKSFSNVTSTSSTGVTKSAAKIEVNGEAATVSIPSGVTLLDGQGQPVTGTISAEIEHYDASEFDALVSFPGGLETNVIMDGESGGGVFVSGGMFGIDLKSTSGQEVKTIQGAGMTIKNEIADSTYNPYTGAFIQDGDTIDLWSLDEDKGEWINEGKALIIAENGKMYVTGAIPHLSYWNFDWFSWWGRSRTCRYGSRITFSGLETNESFYMSFRSYGFGKRRTHRLHKYNNYVQLYNVMSNRPGRMYIHPYNDNVQLSTNSIYSRNFCSGNYSIDVSYKNPPPKYVNLNFGITIKCAANKQAAIRPSLLMYYYEVNSNGARKGRYNRAIMRSGRMSVRVKNNGSYGLMTYIEGRWEQTFVKVEDVGNGIKVNYDESFQNTSLVNLKGNITFPKSSSTNYNLYMTMDPGADVCSYMSNF